MSNTNRFTLDGRDYHVLAVNNDIARRKVRVYVETPDIPTNAIDAMIAFVGAPHRHTKIGDYPLLDLACKQHNALIVEAQRHILNKAISVGLVPTPDKPAKHSRYAGCSCPCSPGWILDVNGSRSYYIEQVI